MSGIRTDSILKLFLATILDAGYRFMFWFRLTKCSNRLIASVSRLFYFFIGQMHHFAIPRNTDIGYGFRIIHSGPVVINHSARIGDNVNMGQFSTIGSLCNHAAIIGNEVYIGPSVNIVENVHIGDGVTIGAGAVVVKNVEGG